MTNAITPTSLAADIKRAIEWGEYLNDRPDLLVSLKQAIFDAVRQTIAAQLTNGDFAKGIVCHSSDRSLRTSVIRRGGQQVRTRRLSAFLTRWSILTTVRPILL
jgi:hypothetical protein